jgi:Spy/CpxP family protein refolding chaperone
LEKATFRKLIAGGLVSVAAAAAGQTVTVKDQLAVTRQAVENQRRIVVSGALPLTDEEADAFWPLYDAYEKERRSIDERADTLVADFLAGAATLTDGQAKAMVEEELRIEEQRVRVRRAYFGRMVEAIPARKVARFFQIDNKIDTAVRADIAKQIPLAPY